MINPNNEELQKIKSHTKIHGLKLSLECGKCGRRWAIWFRGQDDFLNNLPSEWHLCGTCNKNKLVIGE